MRALFDRLSHRKHISGINDTPEPETEANPFLICETVPLPPEQKLESDTLNTILARWRGWRDAAGGTPDWSVFRPSENVAILPNIVIYDLKETRLYVSLIGEEARQNLPIQIHRRFLDDVMPASNLADMQRRLLCSLDMGQPNHVRKSMGWKPGHGCQIYDSVQIPFIYKNDTPNRILSVMSFCQAEGARETGHSAQTTSTMVA